MVFSNEKMILVSKIIVIIQIITMKKRGRKNSASPTFALSLNYQAPSIPTAFLVFAALSFSILPFILATLTGIEYK